jgi:hypothetical protein
MVSIITFESCPVQALYLTNHVRKCLEWKHKFGHLKFNFPPELYLLSRQTMLYFRCTVVSHAYCHSYCRKKVYELCGDSETMSDESQCLVDSDIIVATPEKWESHIKQHPHGCFTFFFWWLKSSV